MLAAPAQTGFGGERDLQYGRAVGEDAIAKRADCGRHSIGQCLKLAPQHAVIVAPKRVARHVRFARVAKHRRGIARTHREIIEPRADHANRSGDELGGPSPAHTVTCHIIHFAVASGLEPRRQPRLFRRETRVGNTDLGETQLARPGAKVARELREIGRERRGSNGHWRHRSA